MNIHLQATLIIILLQGPASYAQSDDMQFFAGKWDFKVWMSTNKTEVPDIAAKWTLEKELDSATCFIGKVEINGSRFTREIIARNPADNNYVRTIVTNSGAYITMHTSGWKRDRLTWIGTQYDQNRKTQLKEEIFRISPDEFKATFFRLDHNQWIKTQSESLKKIVE